MAETLLRTAHSAFVKETEDFSCQVVTREGLAFANPRQFGAPWYSGIDYAPLLAMFEHRLLRNSCAKKERIWGGKPWTFFFLPALKLSMEDWLEEDSVGSKTNADSNIADQNWNRLQSIHGSVCPVFILYILDHLYYFLIIAADQRFTFLFIKKAGYREGLLEGKEKSIQEGFDQGFREGINKGLKYGFHLGQKR